MIYLLDLSKSERNIVKQSLMARVPIPERIANSPKLAPGLELYLQAFFDLNSERSHGMGLTQIPWSCIKNYAEFYDFSERQTESLFYHVRVMDEANLNRLDKKQARSRSKGKSK